jgi:hypothetical protein
MDDNTATLIEKHPKTKARRGDDPTEIDGLNKIKAQAAKRKPDNTGINDFPVIAAAGLIRDKSTPAPEAPAMDSRAASPPFGTAPTSLAHPSRATRPTLTPNRAAPNINPGKYKFIPFLQDAARWRDASLLQSEARH